MDTEPLGPKGTWFSTGQFDGGGVQVVGCDVGICVETVCQKEKGWF